LGGGMHITLILNKIRFGY